MFSPKSERVSKILRQDFCLSTKTYPKLFNVNVNVNIINTFNNDDS